MDTKSLSNVLIRLSGIVIISVIVVGLPGFFEYYVRSEVKTVSLFFFSVIYPNVLPLIVGVVMFTKSEKISNKLIFDDVESQQVVDLVKVECLALSVLGFYLLFNSLSDLVFNLSNWSHAKYVLSLKMQGEQNVDKVWVYSNLFSTLVEILFSLCLILKSKGIVNVLNKLRN